MRQGFFLSLASFAVAVFGLQAHAQPAGQGKAIELRGRIVKTSPEHFIVETPEKKEITVYVHPKTKYLVKDKAAKYSDFRVGSTITTYYIADGDRYLADSVNLFIDGGQPSNDRFVEGEIIRVVGEDQVIVRTYDGKEIAVFVDPKTRYELSKKEAGFTDLRKGVNIGVYYDMRDKRYYAQRVMDLNLVEGEVVRVVGKDRVIVKTADGKELIVYVNPDTRYALTEQGGTFTDLRPGAPINVYYNERDRRNNAHRIFRRRNN